MIGGNTTDSRHNHNKQKDHMRSFTQILKSNQERSTLVLGTKTSGEFNQLTAGGKLFRRARDKNSIVIATTQFDNYNTN